VRGFNGRAGAAAGPLPHPLRRLLPARLNDATCHFRKRRVDSAPARRCSGKAVLPQAHNTDIYLTAVGVALTGVYVTGLLFRPTRRIARMGIDSFVVLVLYVLAVAGLFAIAAST
jgi:hypothetical protein